MKIGCGLALAALLWAPVACKRKKPNPQQILQETTRIPTTVHMGDPRAGTQIVSGFYDIEEGAWRWTGKEFQVELGTPLGAASRGATLELQFSIPEVAIAKNPSITLSSMIDGSALPPETFTTPGAHVYKRDVPASVLGTDAVRVVFEVDKTMSPGGADSRVLGVVVTSVGLLRKPDAKP